MREKDDRKLKNNAFPPIFSFFILQLPRRSKA
ncbi:unnamed protein product [Acanthoscelides obtectus]|uniref:Uncharacterized protein n=1 Tax=Acanthoscelides obtectus TaxID=200917 RepID=A0A9P0PHV1_ACAOB|nr:unnamed protein product [Acanthoscelides obtectus]CAK1641946.1 hypothetical protein AOBTE_LOCUS12746 [Acanthoscelides obtectus]